MTAFELFGLGIAVGVAVATITFVVLTMVETRIDRKRVR